MVIVYLSNRYIRVIDGEASNGKLHARHLLYTVDTKGCILNGTITNDEAFAEIISDLWESNHLSRKGVKLVIDSSQFTMKVVEAPKLKPKMLLDFISREFNDVDRIANPVYGCFEVQEEQAKAAPKPDQEEMTEEGKKPKKKKTKASNVKMQRIFATMAPRELLQKYMDIFNAQGIEVDGVGSALGAALRLTAISPHKPQETGIVQMVDDMTLTSFLFVDGTYQYSSRTRLFSDVGTPQYAVEIARNVSNLLQFAKAQDLATKIPRALIAGLDVETFHIYKDSVEQIDPEMDVDVMDLNSFVHVDQPPVGEQDTTNFVMALGGLLATNKKTNLVVQMAWNAEKDAQKKKRMKTMVPILGLAGVMLLAVLVLGGRLLYYSIQQKELDAYNNRADVVADVQSYDEVSQQVAVISTLSGSMTSLEQGVLAYPRIDSATEAAVVASAGGLVEAQVSSYDASTGITSLNATADNVDRIYQFVEKLTKQDIFAYVDYTGYSQDSDGKWTVKINCTMAAREEAQDGSEAN